MSPVLKLVRALVADGVFGAALEGVGEGVLVVGLDPDGAVCGVAVNPRHRALSFVKVWELEAIADELGASALVVAAFPPGRGRAPSEHEVRAFVDLRSRAHRAQVELLDCILVRGGRMWSLREQSWPGCSCEAGLVREGADPQSRPAESDL